MVLPEKVYDNILKSINEGIFFVNKDKKITYWNKAAEKLTGFKKEDVYGKKCFDILKHVNNEGINLCKINCPISNALKDKEEYKEKLYLHHKDGHQIPIKVKTKAIKDHDNIIGAIQIFNDISHNLEMLQTIRYLRENTYIDSLTQIGSRNYSKIFLNQCLEEFSRYDINFGIGMFDINNFSRINEKYSQNVGDRLLKTIAKTFLKNLRTYDFIGRWDDDQFIIILKHINNYQIYKKGIILKNLVKNSYINVKNKNVSVNVAGGVTIVKQDDTADQIIQRAENLLKKSKEENQLVID